MDQVTVTKRGVRVELHQVIKDCHPNVGLRQGRIMQFDGDKVVINWGPGQYETRVSLSQIHENISRRTGYALLKSWSPARRRS